MNQPVNFKGIDQWILLGGGEIIGTFSLKLVGEGFKVFVVTSQRHADEKLATFQLRNVTLRDFLVNNKIDFLISKDVNRDRDVISRITKKTLGVSVGAAWIFREKFIQYFEGRLVNFHPSKLPQGRGGGPWSWKVLKNERIGTVTLHQIDTGIDTGNIIRYRSFHYPSFCKLPIDYMNYTTKQYYHLLEKLVRDVKEQKEIKTVKQNEDTSTYWPRFCTDIHGYIDWSWKLTEIERFIRAFDEPYKGAMTFVHSVQVRLKRCEATYRDGRFHPFQKGIVYRVAQGSIFVACDGGGLVIHHLKDGEGRNMIDKIRAGDRFYTPLKYLEQAKQSRAIYTALGMKIGTATAKDEMHRNGRITCKSSRHMI